VELVWLTGKLMPDFKTIADFRKDNGAAIRRVCAEFMVLCRQMKLFTESVVAIDGKLKTGSSVELVNRTIRVLKAVLNFALDKEMIERNPVTRFRLYEGRGNRVVKRDAFEEGEIRALLACARPHERALVGLLCFTGLRPGEAFALRWQDVDLIAGTATVTRTWDHRGQTFTAPKTAAGNRMVALSGWVVSELTAHKARSDGIAEALVFANRNGKPMNPSNLRRDVWLPLRKRARVRELDLYSLRHTFASLGRTSGESAFNVSRAMGHSRSTLVDAVYAHSLQSGMASVAERVTARALGEQPKLRVIEGGQRDVRQPLDESPAEGSENRATA
jgi:integrase